MRSQFFSQYITRLVLVETLGGIAPPTKQFLHVFAKEAAGTNTDRTGTGRRRRAASASSFVVHHTQQIRVQSLFCEPTLDIGQVVHTLNRKCSISMSHPPARGPSRLAGSLPSSPGPPGLAPQPLTQTAQSAIGRIFSVYVALTYIPVVFLSITRSVNFRARTSTYLSQTSA